MWFKFCRERPKALEIGWRLWWWMRWTVLPALLAKPLRLMIAQLSWSGTQTSQQNFPSLSVLLAGLLVPVNLSINYACHVSQVFLVLLPIGIVTALSEYADRAHPYTSIPGLRLWARITACTVLVVMCCRLIMMKRITSAQRDLCAKSEAVRSKLAHLEKDPRDLSFTDLRELFAAHASTLQQAVVCESYCTSPIMSHIIGFGTLIWLLSTFYNTYLYFAYMFVPGRVTETKLFSWAIKEDMHSHLGGGFKDFLFSPLRLWKESNLTDIFQMGCSTTN